MKMVIRFMFRHWLGKRFHPLPDTAETGDGYTSFGFVLEPGKELPIGFSEGGQRASLDNRMPPLWKPLFSTTSLRRTTSCKSSKCAMA